MVLAVYSVLHNLKSAVLTVGMKCDLYTYLYVGVVSAI